MKPCLARVFEEKKMKKGDGGGGEPFCQPFSHFFESFIYKASKALFMFTEKFETDSSEDADDTFCELPEIKFINS